MANKELKKQLNADLHKAVAKRIQSVKDFQGMSQSTFFFGVMNLAITSFLCGAAPELMWLYTTVKILILVPTVFVTKYKRKTHWYMVDMCWAILYGSCLMGITMFILNYTKPELFLENIEFFINGFYAYFGFACGPIGLYVIWNQESNLMVFHSQELISSVFIHLAPMYTAWALRWHHTQFRETWPLMKHLSLALEKAEETTTFEEFVWPSFIVYMIWWIPYAIWLLTYGLKLEEQGIEIGYTYFATFGVGKVANFLTCGKVPVDSKYGGVISYLFVHFAFIFVPSICICYIFFISYHLNLALMIIAGMLTVHRGAKYYNYLMVGAFEKILREAEASAAAEACETDEAEEIEM